MYEVPESVSTYEKTGKLKVQPPKKWEHLTTPDLQKRTPHPTLCFSPTRTPPYASLAK